MRVAIIGCGYVGSAVAKHWHGQGLDVLVTTTRQERVAELSEIASRVEVLTGTARDRLTAALQDRQVVLLCVASKRGASYSDTYLSTAQTMAQVLPETPVEQLIYTSSCSIYGQFHGAWVTELMPPMPVTDNGKIIEQTEETLLSAATPGRKICVLRLGGIYGPGRTLEKIYSRAAGTTRPGKGEEATNWVHLSDIVSGIDWAKEKQLEGRYNLVQEEVPTVKALIDRVCRQHTLSPVIWDASQPSTRKNVRVSNAKIKGTGYQFQHPTFNL
ncbi:MAG: NAD-dependent epimerase/dehydratase family protein [Cyanobacteria bacterium P01_D01_bin.105]